MSIDLLRPLVMRHHTIDHVSSSGHSLMIILYSTSNTVCDTTWE